MAFAENFATIKSVNIFYFRTNMQSGDGWDRMMEWSVIRCMRTRTNIQGLMASYYQVQDLIF